jgi:ubiquinone/menaquinone biosynthesis C-methylase UbiE
MDPAELEAAVRAYYRSGYGSCIAPGCEGYYVESSLGLAFAKTKLDSILRYRALRPGDKVLEVGCGFGSFVLACTEAGYDAVGLDPNELGERMPVSVLEIARSRMSPGSDRLVAGYGENLPFAAETFDVVALFQVLEHVRDPRHVLQDAYRVLKRGGMIYFHSPNYLSFYEGHYGLPWLPMLPKPFARIYVRLLGRDPYFLEHLHYTTPPMVKKLLAELGYQKYENLALDSFRENMRDVDRISGSVYRRLGRLIRALGLSRLAEKVIECGWVYPVRFAIYK